MFRNITNSSDEMKAITKAAEDALRKIGKESPINARRVGKFGIKVEDGTA